MTATAPHIVLFGETEKGEFNTPYFFYSLPELVASLGNPPPDTRGLYYAVQALLYHYNLIFFRVKDEGYSYPDYLSAFNLLLHHKLTDHLLAICAPGVGDRQIIDAMIPVCGKYHSIVMTNEADFYDYLTS